MDTVDTRSAVLLKGACPKPKIEILLSCCPTEHTSRLGGTAAAIGQLAWLKSPAGIQIAGGAVTSTTDLGVEVRDGASAANLVRARIAR